MKTNFNKKKLMSLGIDERKSEFIEFLIKNENLDQFNENENFYYWFSTYDYTLKKRFKFINVDNDQKYIYNYNGKEFDLNSFEGIAQMVVHVKSYSEIYDLFDGNLAFHRTEYFLRYSKKYKKLEYYFNYHNLQPTKKQKYLVVRHKKTKIFNINEKNYVLFYRGNNMPRYVSNKNALFLRPLIRYNNDNVLSNNSFEESEKYLRKINMMLLSIHQKNNIYNEENFIKTVLDLDNISNKLMTNISSLDQVLRKITNDRPVPKILHSKFEITEIISLYSLVEYEEVDKIIKFIYENVDIYEELEKKYSKNKNFEIVNPTSIISIIKDFISVKLNIIKRNDKTLSFDFVDSHNHHYIDDYIRLSKLNNKKLNLKIKSIKRLIEEHDNHVRNMDIKSIPEIKVKKIYPEIKSTDKFQFEKIKDKKRLVLESQIQKHCVKTYASIINLGTCCIYSVLDLSTNLRWTIEVCKFNPTGKKLLLFVNQFQGKFNQPPSQSLRKEIMKVLESYEILEDKKIELSRTNDGCLDFEDLFPNLNNQLPNRLNNEILPF